MVLSSGSFESLGLGEPVNSAPVSGGCIAQARRVTLADGRQVFVKTAAGKPGMFPSESVGLQALADAGVIRIPEVLAVNEDALALEWIDQGSPGPGFSETFGRQFAALHEQRGARCGFDSDNYIGATPQINDPVEGEHADGADWPQFFMQQRLLFQGRLAEQNGHGPDLLRKLESAAVTLLDIFNAAIEPPSLLHGDLWSGNYLVDESGAPCLIDPAVYYGHREADLAMTRWFGGFSAAFYYAYEEALPLQPGSGERIEIYRLYHVLNHLNLFGRGYYGAAVQILAPYSAR